MKEVLLNIGSIVEVEYNDVAEPYLIVGKRIVNHQTMRAWDYYSVPYPAGARYDDEGRDDVGFFFNHYEIESVLYSCDIEAETLDG